MLLKDGATIATILSITISVSMIGVAVYFVDAIYSDINEFYEESMKEFVELQTLSEDAWSQVMVVSEPHTAGEMFERLLGRQKRELPVQCNCLAQSMCPQGPPGPPGNDGLDGDHGTPGPDGPNGLSALDDQTYAADTGCIKCPAGPPGRKGPSGQRGAPGPAGRRGEIGEGGADGIPGPAGPPGDAGQPGRDGQPGTMGNPGTDGVRYLPGPAGRPGMPGARGPPGETGAGGVAEEGPDGLPGPAGPAGRPGMPGPVGKPGEPGGEGIPGPDAAYCPCPKRGQVYVAGSEQSEPETEKEVSRIPAGPAMKRDEEVDAFPPCTDTISEATSVTG